MTRHRILGIQKARKQFSSLVQRACLGKTTLITRHGKRCARTTNKRTGTRR